MEEKKQDGETPKEESKEETKVEDKVIETTPVIERARQEREAMDKTVAALKIENDRSEAIMAKRALGGDSEAGQPAEKKEETPLEYKDRIMANL